MTANEGISDQKVYLISLIQSIFQPVHVGFKKQKFIGTMYYKELSATLTEHSIDLRRETQPESETFIDLK